MKKSDLKNRMVLENRQGDRFILIDDLLMRDYKNYNLDYLDSDLLDRDGEFRFDIVKVYHPVRVLKETTSDGGLSLLWEREWSPNDGDIVYYPDITCLLDNKAEGVEYTSNYRDRDWWNYMISNNLVFRTQEEAVECARKMLDMVKEEY